MIKSKAKFIFFILFSFNISILFSQQISEEYINFVTGSLEDKTQVLSSLTITAETDKLTASLPMEAINYITKNIPVIGNVSGFADLALVTVPFVQPNTVENASKLWQVFNLINDDELHTLILSSFKEVAPISKNIILPYLPDIHTFVAESIATNKEEDLALIQAIELLEIMTDPSSFDLLFRIALNNQIESVNSAAVKAVNTIITNSQNSIVRFMSKETTSIEEKKFLFTLTQNNEKISSFLKAEMAEKALSATIIDIEDYSKIPSDVIELQLLAVKEIAKSTWTRAAPTVAKYFAVAQKEFEANLISETDFIEIIKCLEILVTSYSSAALSDYLSILNSQMASPDATIPCSEQVILAVINALGALGDKAAFDNLLYVTYLPYPDTLVTAARNALANLKW